MNFLRASGGDFGCPRAPSKLKNHDFHRSVVQNRRSTFSRPRLSVVGFGNKNGTKINPECFPKSLKTKHPNEHKNRHHKYIKNAALTGPREAPGDTLGDFRNPKNPIVLSVCSLLSPLRFKFDLSASPGSPGTSPDPLWASFFCNCGTSKVDLWSKSGPKLKT